MSKFKNMFGVASPPPDYDASRKAYVMDEQHHHNNQHQPHHQQQHTTTNRPHSRSVSGSTPPPDKQSQAQVSRRNSSATAPITPVGPKTRFYMTENGSHGHILRSGKRQEKLTSMLREFLGGKKKEEAVSPAPQILEPPQVQMIPQKQPPSLMAGLVTQIQKGARDPDQLLQHAAANPESFMQKYGKCQEVIGRGSFGVVRVAHKPNPGQSDLLFAVKEFKKRPQENERDYNRRLTSEFCISSSLHHPNIIQTLDLLQDAKGVFCEVMEFCSGGDLYTLVLAAGKLEYAEADCFFKQILRGVNYMHEMGIAHRDLKPENILLTAHGSVKITDFGNGECFRMAWEKEIHLSNGLCGSAPYIAPEEFSHEAFDPRAVDIWAVGVIYMAMRTGRHLWGMAKHGDDEFYDRYLRGRKAEKGYEPIENLKRARCRNVIYSILDPVPQRRITGRQILKSEWGREIHVCQAGEMGA